MSGATPGISIVLPILNEEDNVEILYDEIRNCMDSLKWSYEIIVDDDCGLDTSFESSS
jgi:glycosyltransferase involved in cell wall biosynthesis